MIHQSFSCLCKVGREGTIVQTKDGRRVCRFVASVQRSQTYEGGEFKVDWLTFYIYYENIIDGVAHLLKKGTVWFVVGEVQTYKALSGRIYWSIVVRMISMVPHGFISEEQKKALQDNQGHTQEALQGQNDIGP